MAEIHPVMQGKGGVGKSRLTKRHEIFSSARRGRGG